MDLIESPISILGGGQRPIRLIVVGLILLALGLAPMALESRHDETAGPALAQAKVAQTPR